MTDAVCNLCGGEEAAPVASDNGLPVVRCRNCGLVYVTHHPSEEALLDLYGEYHSRGGGDEDSWAMLMRDVFRESAGILDAARNGKGPGRLLDIGCGFGDFIAAMRLRDWHAEGLDPSPKVVDAAAGKDSPSGWEPWRVSIRRPADTTRSPCSTSLSTCPIRWGR